MKSVVSLGLLSSFFALVEAARLEMHAEGGYIQNPSGTASFTMYSGCNQPACGKAATGYTAALNQLSFGSSPGIGPGDACGRCFALTANADPYSPAFTGPFNSIVVKVTDLCPKDGNEEWCGQTTSSTTDEHGMSAHFDLCEDNDAAAAFFPSGHGALTGSFTEVSCSEWSGSDGADLWNGACLAGESAGIWPAVGCGNQGEYLITDIRTSADQTDPPSGTAP
ncbi:hypothetical protein ACEPAH_3423 [Sanghuangporus vaninii]